MRYRFLRFPGGKPKAVTLSYDDGLSEDMRFSDTITACGMKATFNLNNKGLRKNCLTAEQVRKYILDRGHEVAVHGALHRAQGSQRSIDGIRDVLECRLELEKKFGIIIRGMAYPDAGITYFENGATYENIKRYLTDLDIAYARSQKGDNKQFLLPTDWHNWLPTTRHANPELFDYIDAFQDPEKNKITNSRGGPRLFYLWGHSNEFARDNGWELLDKICEKLAGKEDIWYATNMEIYEYVNAYNSLIFSADGTIIRNPTHFEIWFVADGEMHSILPGQTLYLE
ncbi:MAG: polysaccharide deacetylase family protein [Oscillospiraceae bacterium]|nr:polysaccharide deacetylase family protein [Oscillospiraceae bacterium]MBQ6698924.1 polysaccharide deacetylase family protein [Oscillospiraceae bacterium]